jgi:hypothetical protein
MKVMNFNGALHNLHRWGITTLALSLRPRQGLAKVQAKSEARESHFMLPKS